MLAEGILRRTFPCSIPRLSAVEDLPDQWTDLSMFFPGSFPSRLVWDVNDEGKATTVDDFTLRQWDVKTLQQTVSVEGGELDKFSAGCHVPFKANQFVAACNQGVKVFDLSSKKYVSR